MSPYLFLADLLVLVHFAFVLFVVLGGLLVLVRRWVLWLHLPAAAWGTLIELGGFICPLTPLENDLRHKAGQAGYSGGFVEHYVLPILYPVGLTSTLQVGLGLGVVAINVAVYGWIFRDRLPLGALAVNRDENGEK